MRTFDQCSPSEQEEIKQLDKFGRILMAENREEFTDEDECWEENYKLRLVIRRKILQILDGDVGY